MRRHPATLLVALAFALVGAVAIGASAAGTDGGIPDAGIPDAGAATGTGGSDQGLIVTPTPLDFGPVQVGGSAGSALSLFNSDMLNVVIIGAPLGKPNTTSCNAFTVTPSPSLPDSVPPQAARSWPVTFKPTAASSYDCQWTLQTNDGNTDVIHLTGYGVVGHITVTPNPVDFGSQPIGGATSLPVTVTNDGSGSISVTSIMQTAGNPPFSISMLPPSFPVLLGPSQSTQFKATFMPAKGGAASGTVKITDDAPSSSGTTVTLQGSGSGVTGGSTISLSPNPLPFGIVPVGGAADATIQVSALGNQITVSGMSITGSAAGDFSFDDASHSCTSGQTCNTSYTVTQGTPVPVRMACKPTAAGQRFATLTVMSNASGGANSATLQCTGTAPQVTVSPTSISYGVVRVSTTGHATLTIGNMGAADLHVSAITFDGADASDFGTAACAAGCTITPTMSVMADVTFTPPARGMRTANLHVKSNDPVNPDVVVELGGIGGLPVMVITQPSGKAINFGGIPVNTTSSAVTVTIQNQGELALNIASVGASPAEYGVTGPTTPLQLSPTATAQWSITCTPDAATGYPGMFTVTGDDPSNGSDGVTLSCTGINSNLTAMPSPLAFGDVRTDRPSTKMVTFTNKGALAVTVQTTHVTAASGFVATAEGTLPRTLAQNDSLVVDVTFTPTADRAYSDTLELHDPSGGTVASVALSGDGRVPAYSVAPTTVDFGSRCVAQADSQDIMIMNTGDAHIQLTSTAISGGGGAFTIASGNVLTPIDLAPTAIHTVTVVGTAAQGTSMGNLVVTTDVTSAMTSNVSLSISGSQSGVVANPSSVDFGLLGIGVASQPTKVTVINCSATTLDVMGYAISGTDGAAFQATGPASASIPIGGNEAWNVVFTAQHAGAHTGQLELHNDGTFDPLVVALMGSGSATSTGGDGGLDGGGSNAEQSTSYYACACRSSSPAGGAPIVLAFALVLRRRRRRSPRAALRNP